MPLVYDVDLAVAGVEPRAPRVEPVYREPARALARDDSAAIARAAQDDISRGAGFIALGLVLTIVSFAVAGGGGVYFVFLGPAFYGARRLARGLRARRWLDSRRAREIDSAQPDPALRHRSVEDAHVVREADPVGDTHAR